MRILPTAHRARKPLLLLASTLMLTALDCGEATAPKHDPIEGAVVGGYFQRLFNGKQANELPSTTGQPSVQYQGSLCLFDGGSYSYARRFWLYNTHSGPEFDIVYGTYQGNLSASLSFSGTVSGGASVAGDTINVGSNQFVRAASTTSGCESQR